MDGDVLLQPGQRRPAPRSTPAAHDHPPRRVGLRRPGDERLGRRRPCRRHRRGTRPGDARAAAPATARCEALARTLPRSRTRPAQRVVRAAVRSRADDPATPTGERDLDEHHALARGPRPQARCCSATTGCCRSPPRPDRRRRSLRREPRYQGAGSSPVQPDPARRRARRVAPRLATTRLVYTPGYDPDTGATTPALLAEAGRAAAGADVAVVCAGLPDRRGVRGVRPGRTRTCPGSRQPGARRSTAANGAPSVVLTNGGVVHLRLGRSGRRHPRVLPRRPGRWTAWSTCSSGTGARRPAGRELPGSVAVLASDRNSPGAPDAGRGTPRPSTSGTGSTHVRRRPPASRSVTGSATPRSVVRARPRPARGPTSRGPAPVANTVERAGSRSSRSTSTTSSSTSTAPTRSSGGREGGSGSPGAEDASIGLDLRVRGPPHRVRVGGGRGRRFEIRVGTSSGAGSGVVAEVDVGRVSDDVVTLRPASAAAAATRSAELLGALLGSAASAGTAAVIRRRPRTRPSTNCARPAAGAAAATAAPRAGGRHHRPRRRGPGHPGDARCCLGRDAELRAIGASLWGQGRLGHARRAVARHVRLGPPPAAG